jgi:putative ABC transport system permease protein
MANWYHDVSMTVSLFFFLRHLTWPYVSRNILKTGLTLLGIALGVAVVVAIQLANQSALSQFKTQLNEISGMANLELVPNTLNALDETILKDWVGLNNLQITPVLEQNVVLPVGPGHEKPMVLTLLGGDTLIDNAFRSEPLSLKEPSLHALDILRPGYLYISASLSHTLNKHVGDTFSVLIGDRLSTVNIAGVFEDSRHQASRSKWLVGDIATVQELTGLEGKLSRIDMIVPDDQVDVLASEFSETYALQGLICQRPSQRTAQVGKMLKAFHFNLTALSFIALLVGLFLVFNTMSIAIIRRRSDIGIIRSVGATQGFILKLFLTEVTLLGFLGSLLGVGLGVFMAQYALVGVASTMEALYGSTSFPSLSIDPLQLMIICIVATVFTILASLPALMEAMAIAPIEATRRGSLDISFVAKKKTPTTMVGLFLLSVSALLACLPNHGEFPYLGFIASFLLLLGFSLLCPVVVTFFLGLGLSRLPRSQVSTVFAWIFLKTSLIRTATAVASLMIGVAMMMSLAMMIGSFKQTVITWVNQSLKADVWVEPSARALNRNTGSLSQGFIEKVRVLPEIQAVDAYLDQPIVYHGQYTNLATGQSEVMMQYGNLMFIDQEASQSVLERFQKQPLSAIVSETFAQKHALGKHDFVTLNSPKGPLKLKIQGVYYDYASEHGYIVLPQAVYERAYGPMHPTGLALYLKPGVNPDLLRDKVYALSPHPETLLVRTNGALKAEVIRIFNNTFSITYALHAIAIAIAILSIVNTLYALVLENKRELSILRCFGATQAHIKNLVITQALTIGFLGQLMGWLLGIALSMLLIYVINRQSFGWTIQWSIPWGFLIGSFFLMTCISWLSGLFPAGFASKSIEPEVLRAE